MTCLLLATMLLACAAPAKLSRQEVIDLLIDQVIKPEEVTWDLIAFSYPEPLTPGDTVVPTHSPEHSHTATAEEWFFWIDDDPFAKYAHPTRFVFINRVTGEITVIDDVWPPVINDVTHFITDEEYWNTDDWAFSNVSPQETSTSPLPVGEILPLVAVTHNPDSALVINGWYKYGETDGKGVNGGEFNIDANKMHDLFDLAGFKTTYLGPEWDSNPDKDGKASVKAIEKWLGDKAKEMKPCETLMIYLTGHGNTIDWDEDGLPDDGYVWVNNEWLAGWQLRKWLEDFKPCVHIHIIIDACYSGAMTNELKKVSETVMTSSLWWQTSKFDVDSLLDPDRYEDDGSEFTSGLYKGLWQILTNRWEIEKAEKDAERVGRTYWQQVLSKAGATAIKNLDPTCIQSPDYWYLGKAEREAKCKPKPEVPKEPEVPAVPEVPTVPEVPGA